MRRLICILLLLCLPLQSFAMQGGPLLYSSGGGHSLGHEFEHAAEIEHHHEHDGSVHYDDSDESVQHIQDNPSSTQLAHLAGPFQPIAPEQVARAVGDALACFIPAPFPDSPLRPPSLSLGLATEGALHA